MVAHETFPGHGWHAELTDPGLRPFRPVLSDQAGLEGWAFWSETLLSRACPQLGGAVLRSRLRRLLPVAVVEGRRARGDDYARRLVRRLDSAHPGLLASLAAGRTMRAQSQYAHGLGRTVAALAELQDSCPDRGESDLVRAYLAAGGMAPEHAAAWAKATLLASQRQAL
jgi:hypothetical protein